MNWLMINLTPYLHSNCKQCACITCLQFHSLFLIHSYVGLVNVVFLKKGGAEGRGGGGCKSCKDLFWEKMTQSHDI